MSGRSLQNEEFFQYTTYIVVLKLSQSWIDLSNKQKALDKNDPLFQQRVYTLVELVICPNPQEKMGHVF